MEKERIMATLAYYKTELENRGFKVIYVGLYGSQNYNVSDEKSDIDAKAIVLPTLSQIIRRKVISAVLETEYGSIDYKDLITFNDVIRKGNFSYVEAIQTKYRIGDTETIDRLFGKIQVNLKSILGGMHEKRKALTHEYPSKVEEFKEFGCDPKQYHHIVRLSHLLAYNINHNSNYAFIQYGGEVKEAMIRIKRELVATVEETKAAADDLIEITKNILDTRRPDYKYELYNNLAEVDAYIEEEIKKELLR